MNKWPLVVKVLLLTIAIAVMSTDFLAQEDARNRTLAAASADAAQFGIKTYRMTKPVHLRDSDTVVFEAALLDLTQSEVGRWLERRLGAGEDAVEDITLEFRGRSVQTVVEGAKTVAIYIDKELIYSGPFAQAAPSVAEKIKGVGELLVLMSTIGRDLNAARKNAEKLSVDWARLSFVPRQARPIAMSLVRWLPTGAHLSAAAVGRRIGPGCDTTNFPHCASGFSWYRTQACTDAKDDAANECSDWVCCIGCCAYANDNCDCSCVSGDFVCACIACGQRCDPCLD